MIVGPGVTWPAAACGRYAALLEALVPAECRRDGSPVDDQLGELLFEMVEAGDRYRSRYQPPSESGTGATTVVDTGCVDLAARTVVAVVIDPHSPAATLIRPF